MEDLLWKLPLFDDIYYSMQGQNVMLVDVYLRDLEEDLRQVSYESDRPPLQDLMIVSALSQMWILAAYELLRTWRQATRDIKRQAAAPPSQPAAPAELGELGEIVRAQHIEQARTDPHFVNELDMAHARVEKVFRRIEALRMNLAKHEVKRQGARALAPGYARMDELTGSVQWTVDLGNKNIEMVTRGEIANDLRRAVIGHTLPEDEPYVEQILDDVADPDNS